MTMTCTTARPRSRRLRRVGRFAALTAVARLSLIVALVTVAAPPPSGHAAWRSGFPYLHDPVPFRHAHERVRVEEREWSAIDLVKDVRYLTKMSHPMTHSSTQVEDHFADANALGPAALDPTADHDLVAANLETPVVPAEKPGMVHELGLRFNSSLDLLDTLATGGAASGLSPDVRPLVDVLGVTNNHSLDRGPRGLTTTMFETAARGMRPVGVAYDDGADGLKGRYVTLDRNGFRVAVTAFTWGINHGCIEGADLTRLNLQPFGDRTSLPDFRLFERVVAAARAEGADLVVGSGPHVLQPLEVLQVNRPAFQGSPSYVEDPTDPAHCRVGALLRVDVARGVERATGRRRALLTNARLALTYTERRLTPDLPPRRQAVLHDVAWALSPDCPDPKLARRVQSALDAADPVRLGAAWLADDARPSRPTLSPTDPSPLPSLLVEGHLAADAAVVVDVPGGAGPARTVRGTLVVTPAADDSLTGTFTPLDDPVE